MAAEIDSTVGGASANSYVSLAEATAYFDARLNAAGWSGAASDDVRTRALIQATRRIDQEEFRGIPVKPLAGTGTDTQALRWPRNAAVGDEGWSYLATVIPSCLKDAQCELALAYLVAGTTDLLADSGLEGFETVKVGPLEVKPKHSRKAGELPVHVRRLLHPVITTARRSARIVRS